MSAQTWDSYQSRIDVANRQGDVASAQKLQEQRDQRVEDLGDPSGFLES